MRAEPIRWSTEELLGEVEWLSRLARRLVSDPGEADDVAQDTWIAALRSRPERGTPLRPWLATVARNLARMRRRSEGARDVRERARNPAAEIATPDELASRLEAQRALVEALTRLREPYRSTVLLTYYERRTSDEIARRDGVSASTVRWRLRVAIDELRRELEQRQPGGREAWVLVVAPLARPSPESSSTGSTALAWQGALLMSNLVKIGAVAAAGLIAAGLIHSGLRLSGGTGSPGEAPMAVTFAPLAPHEDEWVPESLPSSREVLGETATESDAAGAPESAAGAAPAAVVDARMIDEAGNPIAGATLSRMSDSPGPGSAVRSGPDGRVRLEVVVDAAIPSLGFEAAAIGRATRYERRQVAPGESIHLGDLVLERVPADEIITGRVVDPEGRPSAHAMVSYRSSSSEHTMSGVLHADESGGFELVVLQTKAHDLDAFDPDGKYAAAHAESVAPGTRDLVLQLRALPRVEVLVRSTNGAPIEHYMAVAYDPEGASSGAASGPGPHAGGRTTLAPSTARFVVHVEAAGYELGSKGPYEGDAPASLEFVLAPVPTLRGRVLADGQPVEGALVAAFQQGTERHEKNGFRVDRDPRDVAHASSDANGDFLLTLRSGGRYVLRASAPGRAASEVELDDYDPRRGLSGITFELTRGGSIEGRVLVPPGREPAGVIVAFSRGDGFAFTRRAETDGTYRAKLLTPGRWEVRRVEFELHPVYMSMRNWPRGAWDEIPTNCEVVEGGVTRFDLDLGGGASALVSIEGQVLVDGRPAGAWSVALLRGSLSSTSSTTSTSTGRAAGSGSAEPQMDPTVGRSANGDPEPSARLDLEGRFVLHSGSGGPARLVLTAVGGELDGMRLVAPIELTEGSNPWHLDMPTAKVSVSNVTISERPEDLVCIVWIGKDGTFAVRPLMQAGETTMTIPAGRLKLWRFDESVVDLDPSQWPALAEVEVRPGESATLRVP